VERAIIFLRSISKLAPKPDINIVLTDTTNKINLTPNISLNRINKYTPAVTRVEEWTNAEIGVGAAIAAGSQAENGICALLVIAANPTNPIINPNPTSYI
jgi:hypothetical protein